MTGLEVPVFSPASATAALSRGAARLELNAAGSYPQGGTTPDETAEVVPLSNSPIPLRIMIRPRGPPPAGGGGGGPDFVYSDAEFEEMRDSIRRFKEGGHLREARGDGFVFGVLTEERQRGGGEEIGGGGGGGRALAVDVDRNRELVRLAHPLLCVFHRAFDDVLGSSDGSSSSSAIEAALRAVADCGFDGILTSGGPGSAPDNIEALSHVVQGASRVGIEVIVGGGVRGSNVQVLRDTFCPRVPEGSRVWFHSSCLTARSGDHVDEEEVEKIATGLVQDRW